MKQVITLKQGTELPSSSVDIWNIEDNESAVEKFEEIVENLKKEFDIYETFEEYKEVMKKVYQIENVTYRDYEDDINRNYPPIKRLSPTEVIIDIDDLIIKVVIVDAIEHNYIEIEDLDWGAGG